MPVPESFRGLIKKGHGFATYPDAHIYDLPGGKTIQHLIFGDFIAPPRDEGGTPTKWTATSAKKKGTDYWIPVRSRQTNGWMKLDQIQEQRILEVNFVDIGQGDGCHMVTPEDCHFIIDAGKKDNMYRFLRWRYNLNSKAKKLPRFYGLISHCDDDHWKGFKPLLLKFPAEQQRLIQFEKLYYQGILQRDGSKLGKVFEYNGLNYLEDFIQTEDELYALLDKKGKKSTFEQLLAGARKNFSQMPIEAVWKSLDQENILYKDDLLKLEVLGPIPENIDGKLCLRWFDPTADEIGKTKNGHSIILMAHIGKMKIMLGGDLNSKSADYLMEAYSGEDVRELKKKLLQAEGSEQKALQKQWQSVIHKCRKVFQAEIAKSCHHGSHDITNDFLQAVNPIVTVISSGDEESYCHPRPETLGAIGKNSRGERPLIYSTELARSSPEYIKKEAKVDKSDKTKQKIVTTYGMISVRTDGQNAIICQKLERNRSQHGKLIKWHIDKLVWNDERQEFVTMTSSTGKV